MELNIIHLYPDLLNLYGDTGNVKCLKKRAEDRGIKVNIYNFSEIKILVKIKSNKFYS